MGKHINEDFLDSLKDEELASQNQEIEVNKDEYPISIMLYASPFENVRPESDAKDTTYETIMTIYSRIAAYARNCPFIEHEYVCEPVYFGNWKPLGNIKQVSGDDANYYHCPGSGYYIFELLCIPKFHRIKQLVDFVARFYPILKVMNLGTVKFFFKQSGMWVDMNLPNLHYSIKNNFKTSPSFSDLSLKLAYKSMQIVASQLFDDKIKVFYETADLFNMNLAKMLEEQIISSFNYKHRNSTKRDYRCKKAQVKAGPKNVMTSAVVKRDMLNLDDNLCWFEVYDAYTIGNMGQFMTGRHVNQTAVEIFDELNASSRHFTDVRWQKYGEDDYVQFIGHLGLFWLDHEQKLVLVSWVYYSSIKYDDVHNNKLFDYCKKLLEAFGGKQEDVYRLYNDIDKT